LKQPPVRHAPLTLVFCAVYERTIRKYGERGIRYVHMEAGHAAQNVSLQVVSLGLGTVPVGAFKDELVKSALKLKADESPLYMLPVGKMED
jgi:SagB-type dehydrogenase family enzyme